LQFVLAVLAIKKFFRPSAKIGIPAISMTIKQDSMTKNVPSMTMDASSLTMDAASMTKDMASMALEAVSMTKDTPSMTMDAPSITMDAVSTTKDLSWLVKETTSLVMEMTRFQQKSDVWTIGGSARVPRAGWRPHRLQRLEHGRDALRVLSPTLPEQHQRRAARRAVFLFRHCFVENSPLGWRRRPRRRKFPGVLWHNPGCDEASQPPFGHHFHKETSTRNNLFLKER
jgi:hypothetical protein